MTARPCGVYADHVDHVDPRRGRPGSALTAAGSTRRWRRIRSYVLNRDGWACRVLVDEAGEVVEAPRPPTPPAGADDPAWLRAACPAHNLSRGASETDNRRRHPAGGPTRWEW